MILINLLKNGGPTEIFSLDNPMEVLARSKTLMIAHGYIVNNARGLYEIEESRM